MIGIDVKDDISVEVNNLLKRAMCNIKNNLPWIVTTYTTTMKLISDRLWEPIAEELNK